MLPFDDFNLLFVFLRLLVEICDIHCIQGDKRRMLVPVLLQFQEDKRRMLVPVLRLPDVCCFIFVVLKYLVNSECGCRIP